MGSYSVNIQQSAKAAKLLACCRLATWISFGYEAPKSYLSSFLFLLTLVLRTSRGEEIQRLTILPVLSGTSAIELLWSSCTDLQSPSTPLLSLVLCIVIPFSLNIKISSTNSQVRPQNRSAKIHGLLKCRSCARFNLREDVANLIAKWSSLSARLCMLVAIRKVLSNDIIYFPDPQI